MLQNKRCVDELISKFAYPGQNIGFEYIRKLSRVVGANILARSVNECRVGCDRRLWNWGWLNWWEIYIVQIMERRYIGNKVFDIDELPLELSESSAHSPPVRFGKFDTRWWWRIVCADGILYLHKSFINYIPSTHLFKYFNYHKNTNKTNNWKNISNLNDY